MANHINHRNIYWLFWLLLPIGSIVSSHQLAIGQSILRQERIEEALIDYAHERLTVIPLGKMGFATIGHTTLDLPRKERLWLVSVYDSSRNMAWQIPFHLPRYVVDAQFDSDSHCISIAATESNGRLLHWIFIDLKSHTLHMNQQAFPVPLAGVVSLKSKAKQAMVVVEIIAAVRQHVAVFVTAGSDSIQTLPHGLATDSRHFIRYRHVSTTDSGFRFTLLHTLNRQPAPTLYHYWLLETKSSGQLTYKYCLTSPIAECAILDAQMLQMGQQRQVIGSYHSQLLNRLAQGLFLTTIPFNTPNSQQSPVDTKFYGWGTMPGFFNYLAPEKRANMIRSRARKQERNRGYEPEYYALIHRVKVHQQQLIIPFEVYQPDQESYWQLKQGLVLGLDTLGTLQWVHPLVNKPIGHPMPVSHWRVAIDTSSEPPQLMAMYSFAGKIEAYSGAIPYAEMKGSTQPLKRLVTNEKPLEHWSSQSIFWDSRRFLAWGYQLVQPPNSRKRDRRLLFYLNLAVFL